MRRCPEKDCSGGSVNRQRKLTAVEVSIIGENWAETAMRCSYCGCVYSRGALIEAIVRGYLDGGITGEGWKPTVR